jgi:hypothetical protein
MLGGGPFPRATPPRIRPALRAISERGAPRLLTGGARRTLGSAIRAHRSRWVRAPRTPVRYGVRDTWLDVTPHRRAAIPRDDDDRPLHPSLVVAGGMAGEGERAGPAARARHGRARGRPAGPRPPCARGARVHRAGHRRAGRRDASRWRSVSGSGWASDGASGTRRPSGPPPTIRSGGGRGDRRGRPPTHRAGPGDRRASRTCGAVGSSSPR